MNQIIFLHVAAFILGSIPFGYLIGKFEGVDVRDQGSGNTGATNVARVVGKKEGYLTLIADISKGLAAVFLVYLLPKMNQFLESDVYAATLGLTAIIGHCYSPFLKFKGGKGVATSLGVFLALAPLSAITSVVAFLIAVKITNYVSLASLFGAALLPVSYFLIGNQHGATMTAAVITAALVASRHKSNIYRFSSGTEPKLSLKRQEQSVT